MTGVVVTHDMRSAYDVETASRCSTRGKFARRNHRRDPGY